MAEAGATLETSGMPSSAQEGRQYVDVSHLSRDHLIALLYLVDR